MDVGEQFRAAIAAAGLTPPDSVNSDGALHRFACNGKRNDDAGWYVLHDDGIAAGAFGSWRTGQSESWHANIGRKLSPFEQMAVSERIERMRREREAAEVKRRDDARARARALLEAAAPADSSHRYLVSKGVPALGIRQQGDALIIPMRDGCELHSLQFIDADGAKRFLPGGRVSGCYFAIGKANGTICIAEGYATGATLREATGHAVAIAFNAGNLEPVARAIRDKLPDAIIIICADDDNRTDSNPGVTKATEAARAVGGLLAIPDFGDTRPDDATDFNDLMRHAGAEAVERAVANARAPEVSVPQPDASALSGPDLAVSVGLIRASDVTPESVRWYWNGWLAAGKLHILAGPAGTGKTTLALALAATISIGGRWPDGTRAIIGDVAMWTGEDGIADTLVPRLIANGADMERIRFVRTTTDASGKRPFDPATDTPALALALSRLSSPPALLIVDPIVSAVTGDSHKNSETRRALQPLVDLGERIGCAIVGISHFSKGTAGRDPVERVTGSIAFGALARVVMACVKTTTADGDPGPRLFARAKSNLGPDGGGFHYCLEQVPLAGTADNFASRVLWGEPVEGEARALLAAAEIADDDEASGNAKEFLRHELAHGPMRASDIFRAGEAHGYSKRQMQRARAAIGARVDKLGMREGWQWTLPKMTYGPEDAEDSNRSAMAPSVPSAGYRARRG